MLAYKSIKPYLVQVDRTPYIKDKGETMPQAQHEVAAQEDLQMPAECEDGEPTLAEVMGWGPTWMSLMYPKHIPPKLRYSHPFSDIILKIKSLLLAQTKLRHIPNLRTLEFTQPMLFRWDAEKL